MSKPIGRVSVTVTYELEIFDLAEHGAENWDQLAAEMESGTRLAQKNRAARKL